MAGGTVELDESGWHTPARDFVPATHRDLPMLRVYLPFIDRDGNTVRWSRYVDVEEHSASLNWFEATRDLSQEQPAIRDLASCMGQPDETTAEALRDAIGDLPLRCLRWVGYGEVPTDPSVRVFGEDYSPADLVPADLEAGRRIPEFAWDAEKRLAWGGRLYPDSLIVAAELSIFRQLRNDPRLDSVSVRVDRDILPGSAGD
ncbi:hypothetical protein [Microbacterium lushaniae]|uniref:Uncharacterized protein n=1 Tax=Microbacterium lushaniae TaxID=2614639 RepID=A0A5J6L7W1_9MICO|nr:hypothetical protein [Microbacterium lushaniae]QEW04555.1 hypothetical protein F6J85_16680 [Microbacterium lushaniae]